MNRLIIKIMYMLLPVSTILIVANIYLNHCLNDNSFYKLNSSVNTLILGHSHTECALDDALIYDTVNLSQSAEAYFYSYYKLKKLVEANPKIRTVILGFSNNVLAVQDKWTVDDEYIQFKYPNYSHLIPIDDNLHLFYKNPDGYVKAYCKAFTIKFKLLFINKKELYRKLCWGGHLSLERNEIPKLKTQQYSTVISKRSADSNLYYLKEIVKHCMNHNIKLILIRTPLYPLYARYNEDVLQNLLRNDFKDIEFWDYADYPLTDLEYGDFLHLNNKGAKIFSKVVNTRLQRMQHRDIL